MACLQSLPAEVLFLIINEIASIRDLAALSAQCRHLHTIIDISARQRFYRISLASDDESAHSLGLFLEIIKDKGLAAYVRKLKIFGPGSGMTMDLPSDLYEDDVRRVEEATKVVGFPNGKKTTQVLGSVFKKRRALDANTLGVMFMSTCPNIEFLELCTEEIGWGGCHCKKLWKFFQGANNNMSENLRNLREVRLLINTKCYMYDSRFYSDYDLLEALTWFHKLPSIELAGMEGLQLHEQHGIKRLAPRKSNITKIHIGHSSLDTSEVCEIIDHCKVLEEFKYSTGGRSSIGGTKSIDRRVMGHSISRHASTLRVLDLDIPIRPPGYWSYRSPCFDYDDYLDDNAVPFDFDQPEYKEDDAMDDLELRDVPYEEYLSFKKLPTPPQPESSFTHSSLRDFTALTHLGIDIGFFTEPDCDDYTNPSSIADRLPPNLEYLCLRGYEQGENEYCTQCVSELLERIAAGCMPRLKEVHGITEYICIAEDVEYPDENPELLWKDPNDSSWDSDESDDTEQDDMKQGGSEQGGSEQDGSEQDPNERLSNSSEEDIEE